MPTLSESERLDWLQLIRTPSIGPLTFHRLIAKYGSAKTALEAFPELSKKSARRPLKAPSRASVEDELEAADKNGARMIAACEDAYPSMLRAIPDPPPILFVRGHTQLFDKPGVALVGARNASLVGRKIAHMLAEGLGAEDYVIVSGLARGIDGAAHEASLQTGTIAVVAGGVDVIYPREHADLTAKIADVGIVLSECAMGQRPTARDFPKRNRLISGLSKGVVVIEAAEKSGTLITARFALEQGRDVFAVPGSPLDPRYHGTNRLIRDGALLVENAQDIIDALSSSLSGARENEPIAYGGSDHTQPDIDPALVSAVKKKILSSLGFTPVHEDELRREVDALPGVFSEAMLDLVLAGEISETSGARYILGLSDE